MTPIFLSAVGDSNDPGTWSGIPFHFLSAARSRGLIDEGLTLAPGRLPWLARRIAWNGACVAMGDRPGGYQYSVPFLEWLWSRARRAVAGGIVVNCFQLLPPSLVGDETVEKWFFIDQTLQQLFDDYGVRPRIGERVAREAVARERAGYRSAAGVMAQSAWAAESLVRDYGLPADRIHVVLPGAGLDLDDYDRWERRAERSRCQRRRDAPLRLVFVGKDWRRKGLDRLLGALRLARRRGFAGSLRVIGCEPHRLPPSLRSIPGVDWIGPIDKRTDTPRFLELVGSADVGCLPSRAEAGGIALREYRALGLVMFGSGVGGAAEYLREGPSIVIAPDAGEGVIAERLLDLEADGERRRDWREQAWSDRRSALWPASVDRLLTFWPRTRIRPTAGRRKDAVPPRRASAGVTAIPDAGIDPPCASGAPAIVVYDHCSPVQVAALERARHRLAAAGYCLVPVELFGGPSAPRRTATTDPRPPGWICLSPNRGGVSRWAWRERTRAFVRLAGVVRRLKPAVIVLNGWFEPVSWWMVAARPWLDARVALVSDSTLADRRRLALIEGLKRRFLRRVDAVFTAGTRQRQYLESLGVAASQVSLGCDVVDNARFLQIDRRSVTDGPPAIIGTAARLVPQKNLVTALDGYARVVGRGGVPPLRWRIAGEGPLEATLKARARSLGAPVEFCGHLPYERMQAFYAGLDLYWQPSRSEAWGLSVNEAMAAGLPVLASTCCGCVDDLVTPDAGWTHGPGLPEIEEGLHRAVAGRAEWPARGARAREVIARWDLDRFANGLADTVRRADRDATRPALNLTSAGT